MFGIISESGANGHVPIEKVHVEELTCDAPWLQHQPRRVDQNRREWLLQFAGLYGGRNNFLWLTKPGLRIDVQVSPGCDLCYRSVTIDGDTRLDIEVAREMPQ